MPSDRNARRITRLLLEVGDELPDWLHEDILALKGAAIAPLLEILGDDDLANEDAPGLGWPPRHAARILGDLQAAEAIEPMLHRLRPRSLPEDLGTEICRSLRKMGAPLVEPALRAYAASDDLDYRYDVASVLSEARIRDERIFTLLLELFEADPGWGAVELSVYGDARALEHLSRAFDAYEVVVGGNGSVFENRVLIELHAAIEELGGSLTAAQELKHRHLIEQFGPVPLH